MIEVDVTTSLVLYGPPLAGKATILESLVKQYGGHTSTFGLAISGHPGVADRVLVGDIMTERGAVRLRTMAGAVWSRDKWDHLFREAEAMLLVLDAQRARHEANRDHVARLDELHASTRGAVVFTKPEFANRADLAAAEALVAGQRLAAWPRFVISKGEPVACRRALLAVLG